MRKGIGFLLFLILAVCSAACAEEDWLTFHSSFGFSVQYPDSLVSPETAEFEPAGKTAEWFLPVSGDAEAGMVCWLAADPDEPDWTALGYRRMPVDEPAVEMETDMDMAYSLYRSEASGGILEEVRLDSPEGFQYVFDVRFPEDDPEDWQGLFELMLESVAFPPQAAAAGSFRLSFSPEESQPLGAVILEEDAEPMWLILTADVTDFALEQVIWDDSTFQPADTVTLWAADGLSAKDSLEIRSYIPDMLPDLRVRCTGASGNAECWYLADSGQTGSLMLISAGEF